MKIRSTNEINAGALIHLMVLPIHFTSKAVDVGPVTRMGRDVSSMSFPALLRCSGVFAAGPSTSFLALTRQPLKAATCRCSSDALVDHQADFHSAVLGAARLSRVVCYRF
jgi:hypothetical protein